MSFSEFLDMHGKAFYVWSAYGMAFLVFAVEVALVINKRWQVLKQVRLLREAEKGE